MREENECNDEYEDHGILQTCCRRDSREQICHCESNKGGRGSLEALLHQMVRARHIQRPVGSLKSRICKIFFYRWRKPHRCAPHPVVVCLIKLARSAPLPAKVQPEEKGVRKTTCIGLNSHTAARHTGKILEIQVSSSLCCPLLMSWSLKVCKSLSPVACTS